ncbi:hypothetical protein B296_00007990 [Ensete ventricosum]|uniref:Uncharacterized protein n=1 Tax=Ensete ventricosum TaxID=4639 RepID=A0A427AJ37_ENSVE|nr:hypothetical protein B296_00007990 [Ensete ventricosum]
MTRSHVKTTKVVRIPKLVRVSRKEIRKLKRGRLGLLRNAPQLGLLKSVPLALPSRGLLRDLARRPRRNGGVRCGLSDD